MATYCGRFDDFAERHTKTAIVRLSQLNQTLLEAVLLGDDQLLINDGYMLGHRALRQAILAPDASPLRRLVEAQYVQILTRNQRRLDELATHMADDGITWAQTLLKRPGFATDYQRALAAWTQQLNGGGFPSAFRSWPADHTTEIFHNVATAAYAEALAAAPQTEARQLKAFRERLDATQGRRTDWEDLADDLLARNALDGGIYRSLMSMANEAYQYAWGCALRESPDRIRVDTELPRHLRLDRTYGQIATQKRQDVKLYAPDLSSAGPAIGRQWDRLAQMTHGDHPTNVAKQRFLRTLHRYYTATDVDHDAMHHAARAYSQALAEHFGDTKKVELLYGGVFLNAVSTAAGGMFVAGPVGAGIGFAVGFATTAATVRWGVPRLVTRFHLRSRPDWVTPVAAPAIPTVSSFEVDPEKAAPYLKGVSRYQPT